MIPSHGMLRHNGGMHTKRESPTAAAAGPRWLARFPTWGSDVLAIAVVLVTSFFGVPMMPGGGRWFGGGGGADGGGRTSDGRIGPGDLAGPGGVDQPALTFLLPLIIVLVACALIPLRRRWPVTVMGTGLALYCLTILLREPAMGVGIVVVLAAYNLGATLSRRTTLIVGATATVIVVALSLTSSEFGVIDVRVFQIAAGIAVAAALGDSSRSKREAAAAATERAERAEQTREAEAQQRVAEERLRIAQDLHDTVAHQISVISLNAGVASNALDAKPEKARTALRTIRRSSREVLSEISELLNYLRTEDETGAAPPQPTAEDIMTLTDRVRDAGLTVTLTGAEVLPQVTGATGRVLYRVVQEGLTNAHKHGSQGTAAVSIAIDGGDAVVTITNPVSVDGRNQPDPLRGGLGLTGIRERVASIGGSVDITTNGTFSLAARLPLKREDNA